MDDRGVSQRGLIVNPSSGKRTGKGLALAEKLQFRITVRVIESFAQLPGFIDEMARAGVTDLFISSGDGTIQAIQTDLAERKPFAQLPRLALLPHGTTNMTAADLGFRLRNLDALARFIEHRQPNELVHRPTLRAANPRDGRPRHGMFLGTGAVSEATLFCQEAFNAKGVRGNWASIATLFSALRFNRPHAIEVETHGGKVSGGNQLLMLSTTLKKLILGSRPFWGGDSAPIRTTVIPHPAPSLARWLLPIMYGAETRKIAPGAISFASSDLTVRSPVSFVIDGEFFDGPENKPLRIETGPIFTYMRA